MMRFAQFCVREHQQARHTPANESLLFSTVWGDSLLRGVVVTLSPVAVP